MQIAATEKLKGRLARLNSPNYSYLKVLFRQLAVYLISLALGMLGFYFLKIPFFESVNSSILSHFSNAFHGCDGFGDAIVAVINYALADIVHILLIFVLGFTMFASLGCSLCFFVRGIGFGLSLGYLLLASANSAIDIAHHELAFFSYVLFSVASAAVLTAYSANAVLFSFEYRKMHPRRRKALEFAFATLVIMGYLILISLVRCAFSVIYTF